MTPDQEELDDFFHEAASATAGHQMDLDVDGFIGDSLIPYGCSSPTYNLRKRNLDQIL